MSNGSIETAGTTDLATETTRAIVQQASKEPQTSLLPRSASQTHLPPSEQIPSAPHRRSSIRRSLSENVLINPKSVPPRPTSLSSFRRRSSLRHKSNNRTESDITVSRFVVGPEETQQGADLETRIGKEFTTPNRQRMKRSISGSISKIARRSWISTSSSPSPLPNENTVKKASELSSGTAVQSSQVPNDSDEKELQSFVDAKPDSQHDGLGRRNSFLGRKARAPFSALLNKNSDSAAPSVPPIPTSFSIENFPSLHHKRSNITTNTTLHTPSVESIQSFGTETPRKRDELWGAFRNLDGEYTKFQSRPSTTKTTIIRSTLLPFLRTYAEDRSISRLRPEDLDRRTVILNKWWTGLLEMLNGRHGESVSGNDRPAILEAVTALMVRPEWTTPPSRLSKPTKSLLKSRSTTSLGSNMSDFLADSVLHNVRNSFTQNLLAQMAYIVDKMSARNVAASVVTFCGKATAYAFFYCEGVADILVRLWNIPSRALRRVTSQFVRQNLHRDTDVLTSLSSAFPPCLRPLSFQGLKSMMTYLRNRPHPPIATAYIHWNGPWVGRWAGRDTDLFYIFFKSYIDLACRLLPESTSQVDRIAVPGWALVHAQILTILDSTLRRSVTHPILENTNRSSTVTFSDLLGEADAAATLVPLPTNGLYRTMAENRLVMLLRDCLSDSNVIGEKAQSIVANSFEALLKAGASNISVFDHSACFALCDFLEEAVVIINRYHQRTSPSRIVLHWPFWFQVYQRFLESQNSMTEVRLLAYIFSLWGTLTNDPERRRDVCVRWLLDRALFQSQFNHWCPMVRAFYMRLLIWRIGRLDPSCSELNLEILDLMHDRLKETWCHFLYLQASSQKYGTARLSTAPCSPAPSRCLLIVRDDAQPARSGMFLTFEDILSSTAINKASPYEKKSSRELLSGNVSENLNYQAPRVKRGWGLLKNIIPFGSANEGTDSEGLPFEESPVGQQHLENRSILNSGRWPSSLITAPDATKKPMGISTARHITLSFKFSLEWMDHGSTDITKDRDLNPPKMPFPALLSRKAKSDEHEEYTPSNPEGLASGPSKYAGRALAEWETLIDECQNFFERRKAEGVPSYLLVETPMLSVDPFRKA